MLTPRRYPQPHDCITLAPAGEDRAGRPTTHPHPSGASRPRQGRGSRPKYLSATERPDTVAFPTSVAYSRPDSRWLRSLPDPRERLKGCGNPGCRGVRATAAGDDIDGDHPSARLTFHVQRAYSQSPGREPKIVQTAARVDPQTPGSPAGHAEHVSTAPRSDRVIRGSVRTSYERTLIDLRRRPWTPSIRDLLIAR